MESFRQAVSIGVDALELDVHVTADGQVVVIHDPTLDRTTDGSGRVDRMRLAEVQAVDAGYRFTADRGTSWPYRSTGITVPTLAEVITTFRDVPLLIEVKTAAASGATRAVIEAHGASSRCIVASFDWRAMPEFRGSGIATGSSRRDTARLLPRALLGLAAPEVGYDVMCMPPHHRGVPLPVGGFARSLAAQGVPVHVWTVDEPDEARRLWQKGVCGIITNDPAAILKVRDA